MPLNLTPEEERRLNIGVAARAKRGKQTPEVIEGCRKRMAEARAKRKPGMKAAHAKLMAVRSMRKQGF